MLEDPDDQRATASRHAPDRASSLAPDPTPVAAGSRRSHRRCATVLRLLAALAIRSNLVFGFVLVALIFVPMEKALVAAPAEGASARAGAPTSCTSRSTTCLRPSGSSPWWCSWRRSAAHGGARRGARRDHGPAALAADGRGVRRSPRCCSTGRTARRTPCRSSGASTSCTTRSPSSTGSRRPASHPVDQAFTRSCIVIPLFALGFTRGTFGALLIVFTLQALFIHANVRFTFGPLRYVLATPEFHHWHHAADPRAYNSNFAGELPVIDKLFGTLHLEPMGAEAPLARRATGSPTRCPTGYLRQMAWPFRSGDPSDRTPGAARPATSGRRAGSLSGRAGWSGDRSGRACPEGAGPVRGPTNEVRAATLFHFSTCPHLRSQVIVRSLATP